MAERASAMATRAALTGAAAPPVVVVGLCSHGLATCRALARAGIEVHALESNFDLPGTRTRVARVHRARAISGVGVVESLLELRPRLPVDAPPVLMLMNDRMIREVAARWPELDSHYRLSWSHCRDQVIRLTDKEQLEQRCREVGLNYPRSWTVTGRADLAALPAADDRGFIVKPALPLGGFKARRFPHRDAIGPLIDSQAASLPFLVQEWIPGGDRAIQFSAVYLDAGRVLARFDGRKLASLPPAMGQAIVVDCHPDDEVHAATVRFFAGLDLSGPASLELKRAPDGSLWVIEPTIGRTDTHFQAWLANGVNAALVEYCAVTGRAPPELVTCTTRIWFDTERDPLCFVRHAAAAGWLRSWRAADFPYADAADPQPFLRAVYRTLRSVLGRRLRRLAHGGAGRGESVAGSASG